VERLFPPLESAWSFGKGCFSANVLERLCDLAQELRGFPVAHKQLKKSIPITITQTQVWEQAERVGADLVRRRDAAVLALQCGQTPPTPANAPDVLVFSPDGGRLQDRARPVGDRWCEYKALTVYRITREERFREGLRRDPQAAVHWCYAANLEKRIAIRAKTYQDPEPEVRTYRATTEKVESFIRIADLEAQQRGLQAACVVAVTGDGGSFIWRTAAEVCETRRARKQAVYEILDVIHASAHLVTAAKALQHAQAVAQPATWLNARLEQLWAGQVQALLSALQESAAQVGPRPQRRKSQTEAGEPIKEEEAKVEQPVVLLWRCHDYFEFHRERIRYDLFRRYGLPLYSAHIESAIKQTNQRVKGTEKAWRISHADEILELRCHALSEDGRWNSYFNNLRQGRIELPTRQHMQPLPLPDPPRPSSHSETN
jgi:hypothetical protein